jgi:hypothetical protein
VDILRVFDPITLQSAEIITVAQISEELLEDSPVSIPASRAKLTLKVTLEVILNPIIVEKRVVDVN